MLNRWAVVASVLLAWPALGGEPARMPAAVREALEAQADLPDRLPVLPDVATEQGKARPPAEGRKDAAERSAQSQAGERAAEAAEGARADEANRAAQGSAASAAKSANADGRAAAGQARGNSARGKGGSHGPPPHPGP